MDRKRVIPCLLLSGNGLYKTRKFKSPVYIGDPVNAVRIFNDKEADELIILDVDATKKNTPPNFALIEEIAGEAFMPIAYGGGISSVEQVKNLIGAGIEKVAINSAALQSLDLIEQLVKIYGSQAIVGAVDYKKTFFGRNRVWSHSGTRKFNVDPLDHVKKLVYAGVGEILINSIDRDGMMCGFDLDFIHSIAQNVNVPVVCCGGAGSYEDLRLALEHGAAAVAAGSMFVFTGKHRAVLINYDPSKIQ